MFEIFNSIKLIQSLNSKSLYFLNNKKNMRNSIIINPIRLIHSLNSNSSYYLNKIKCVILKNINSIMSISIQGIPSHCIS